MTILCRRIDLGVSARFSDAFHRAFKRSLKYILLIANVLIISDAIFLLINEKDSYQGEFIKGRHPVSKLLMMMIYLDIQSFCMIFIGALGIIGMCGHWDSSHQGE